MARIRSMHPPQWSDADFCDLTPLARLLCIALRNFADDHGVFEWKPREIKIRCLPADDSRIEPLLAELARPRTTAPDLGRGSFVTPFWANGKLYGAIRNFGKYQRAKKPSFTFPCPLFLLGYLAFERDSSEITPSETTTIAELMAAKVPRSSELKPVIEGANSEIDARRLEVRDKRLEERDNPLPPKDSRDDFDHWFDNFPRKTAKGQARKAYKSALKKTDASTLLRAARAYAATRVGEDDKFTKHPATWLNGECWLEETPKTPAPSNGAGHTRANGSRGLSPTDEHYRAIMAAWVRTGGLWAEEQEGPKPGEVGCRVPVAIQAEFALSSGDSA